MSELASEPSNTGLDRACEGESKSFDAVRDDWTRLGALDPLWAVYVAEGKRGGRWDPEQFLATGRADVAAAVDWLAGLGLGRHWARVLDFGCGAGRLTQALADYADEVVGVDVSPPMLAVARELDPAGRCRFVLNETADLQQFADGSFDLVYSDLVLQHLPARVIDGYVAEIVRVLAPAGVAVLGCTTRPLWTFKGVVWWLAPGALVRFAQRWLLRYPAPMRMTRYRPERLRAVVAARGGEVLATRPIADRATHWRSTRYVVRG